MKKELEKARVKRKYLPLARICQRCRAVDNFRIIDALTVKCKHCGHRMPMQ